VRAAQRLRGGDSRHVGRLRRLVVPVLEDALERSLALAAGMDTRGYGRSAGAPPAERRLTGGLMLLGVCGVAVGVYAGLDHTAPRVLAWPMLVLGVVAAVGGLVLAGRRVGRTRYRPDPWRWPEFVVMLSGIASAVVAWWVASHQLVVAYPGLATFPEVTPLALVGVLLGLVPAVAAPEPRMVAA
jgi:energy-coupling factor transport system permease protein